MIQKLCENNLNQEGMIYGDLALLKYHGLNLHCHGTAQQRDAEQ